MDIIELPKDVANKILNNIIEIKISEKKKKWRKIHGQLFKGYIMEGKGNLIIFKNDIEISYDLKRLYKFESKWPEMCEKILKDSNVEPSNYLDYNNSYVSDVEFKDIDYYWIIRIPKLISY